MEEILVSLKSDNNNSYCTCRPVYIYDNILLNSSQNELYLILNLRENQNTLKIYTKNFQKLCHS